MNDVRKLLAHITRSNSSEKALTRLDLLLEDAASFSRQVVREDIARFARAAYTHFFSESAKVFTVFSRYHDHIFMGITPSIDLYTSLVKGEFPDESFHVFISQPNPIVGINGAVYRENPQGVLYHGVRIDKMPIGLIRSRFIHSPYNYQYLTESSSAELLHQ
ncbi:hypothetical protein C4573_02995 [Candidatus Woesearchaeota archaeon]|nr:MAG: hypothetical protein C4573_02995 [Candidatus Woesearchaeota archaeon]